MSAVSTCRGSSLLLKSMTVGMGTSTSAVAMLIWYLVYGSGRDLPRLLGICVLYTSFWCRCLWCDDKYSLRAKEVSCQQRHENMQRRSINANELNMNLQSRFVLMFKRGFAYNLRTWCRLNCIRFPAQIELIVFIQQFLLKTCAKNIHHLTHQLYW